MADFDQSWHRNLHWLVNSTGLEGIIKVIFTVRVTAVINLFMDRILSARTVSEVKYLRVGPVNNADKTTGSQWFC